MSPWGGNLTRGREDIDERRLPLLRALAWHRALVQRRCVRSAPRSIGGQNTKAPPAEASGTNDREVVMDIGKCVEFAVSGCLVYSRFASGTVWVTLRCRLTCRRRGASRMG